MSHYDKFITCLVILETSNLSFQRNKKSLLNSDPAILPPLLSIISLASIYAKTISISLTASILRNTNKDLSYTANPFISKSLMIGNFLILFSFTPKRSITVNPPSETLHVSSIKKENCNENSLRKIFGAYGTVEKVKILMQSNEKNMALVRFCSMRESFEAISDLHNKQFGGRKMQISFTKSKL